MRRVRAAWRLSRICVHLLHGLAVIRLRFASLDAAGRQQRIQWWSAKLVRLAGVELRCNGTPRPGPTLLLANHISWLDIAVIHAVAPRARFVSKAEVLKWPLLGRLVAGAGTLFIERERKRDALRVLHQVAASLRAGDMVAVFPEGTTGNGRDLLPFHANLLQAAIGTGTPVQGVVLRYNDARHRYSPAVEFLGDTTLLQTVWRMLSTPGLCVDVDVLSPQGARHADRRALAQYMHDSIAERLQHGDSPPPPAAGDAVMPPSLSRIS